MMAVLVKVCLCLLFSCLAVVVPSGEGDFLHLAFADASRPFERYALPFVECATFDSSYAVGQEDLRLLPFCRCAFSPGSRPCFPCSLDFQSSACLRLRRVFLPQSYLLPRPADYVQPDQCGCFQLFPLRLLLPGPHARINSQACFQLPLLLLPLRPQVPARLCLAPHLQPC